MKMSDQKGGVLPLIVVLAVFLTIFGVAMFLLAKQFGGSRELNLATESGALNKAKQSLKRPGVELQGADEINHFQAFVDPDTARVNLKTYNRLVGLAVLVSANAKASNGGSAGQHADQVIGLVQGVGTRLNADLTDPERHGSSFADTAQRHVMRMLGGDAVKQIAGEHDVSRMARTRATNVILNQNQIPPGGPNIAGFIENKNNKNYLKGYERLSVGGRDIFGVPLRPGETPHLVSSANFYDNRPLNGLPNYLPPNAFRSAGQAKDSTSRKNVKSISFAVVSAINEDFPVSHPRGVIIVDNTGSLNLSGNVVPGGNYFWSTELMYPNFIQTFGPGNANDSIIADSGGGGDPMGPVADFAKANKADLQSGDVTKVHQLTDMINAVDIDSFPNSFPDVASLTTPQGIDFLTSPSNSTTKCTNGSVAAGGTKTTSGGQPCNLEKFQDTYNEGSGSGGGGGPVDNLMAVEKYHLDICEKRASGAECATINAAAGNTGLKVWSPGDCGLTRTREGTLRQLLAQTRASSVLPDLQSRMRQIRPQADAAELNGVLDSPVKMGRVMYIYIPDETQTLRLSESLPPGPLPPNPAAQNLPDGQQQSFKRFNNENGGSLDGITNCGGECGWPHPWDCPMGSQARGQDRAFWTPSSGFGNILGVIKFLNEAKGGGEFCCPC